MDKETQALLERLREGVTWSDGKRIGAVVGEVNDPVMRQAADTIEALERSLAQKDEALRWYAEKLPYVSLRDRARAALTPADEREIG